MVYSTVKIITSVCNNLDEPQESHLEKKSLLAKEYIIVPFMMELFFSLNYMWIPGCLFFIHVHLFNI